MTGRGFQWRLVKLNVFHIDSSHDEGMQKRGKRRTQVESTDFGRSERGKIYTLTSPLPNSAISAPHQLWFLFLQFTFAAMSPILVNITVREILSSRSISELWQDAHFSAPSFLTFSDDREMMPESVNSASSSSASISQSVNTCIQPSQASPSQSSSSDRLCNAGGLLLRQLCKAMWDVATLSVSCQRPSNCLHVFRLLLILWVSWIHPIWDHTVCCPEMLYSLCAASMIQSVLSTCADACSSWSKSVRNQSHRISHQHSQTEASYTSLWGIFFIDQIVIATALSNRACLNPLIMSSKRWACVMWPWVTSICSSPCVSCMSINAVTFEGENHNQRADWWFRQTDHVTSVFSCSQAIITWVSLSRQEVSTHDETESLSMSASVEKKRKE